jgi:hypothetical protein
MFALISGEKALSEVRKRHSVFVSAASCRCYPVLMVVQEEIEDRPACSIDRVVKPLLR